jgi:2-dehydro-3-deoxyphosphooctonate aldolase (KDO 8-P synthase)
MPTVMHEVAIGPLRVSNILPLLVIAGPCQLESLDHAQMIAGRMAEACRAAGAEYVFKASYDKANRTSLKGRRGLGMDEGLKVLQAVRAMGLPVLTDVHDAAQGRVMHIRQHRQAHGAGGRGGGGRDPDPRLSVPTD